MQRNYYPDRHESFNGMINAVGGGANVSGNTINIHQHVHLHVHLGGNENQEIEAQPLLARLLHLLLPSKGKGQVIEITDPNAISRIVSLAESYKEGSVDEEFAHLPALHER